MSHLKKSLEAWRKTCPKGAKKTEAAASKDLNTFYQTEDPEKEAISWLSSLNLKKINVLYLYGVGKGYDYHALQNWLGRNAHHHIVFFEDDPEAVRALFETGLGEKLVNDPQVDLIFFEKDEMEKEVEKAVERYALFPYKVSGLRHYLRTKASVLMELNRIISFQTKAKIMGRRIARLAASPLARNVLYNLLHLPHQYLAEKLFGKFAGVPAIVVGAGPSLEKNVEVLRKLKERTLIIAGGKAVNALSQAGIMPHFCLLTDPSDRALMRQMSHYAYDSPTFFTLPANYKALNQAFGRKILFTSGEPSGLEEWIYNELGLSDRRVASAPGILAASVEIAAALGCTEIYTVGADFAFTDGLPFAPLTPEHPLFTGSMRYKVKNEEEEIVGRTDIHGNVVMTLLRWLEQSLWFSKFVLANPRVELLNATEGGIGFPGIENIALDDAAKKGFKKEFDFERLIGEALDSSAASPKISQKSIDGIYRKLSDSLKNVSGHLEALIGQFEDFHQKLLEGKEVPEKFINEKVTKTLLALENEAAYGALIKEISGFLMSLFAAEFEHLNAESEFFGREEGKKRQVEIHLEKFRLLKSAAEKSLELVLEVAEAGKEFDFAGQPKIEIPYKNGKIEGEVKIFLPSNEQVFSASFHEGKKEGEEHLWYPDGKKMMASAYRQGMPCGKAEFWDRQGRLCKEVVYSSPGEVEKISLWDEEGNEVSLPSVHGEGTLGKLALELHTMTGSLEKFYEKVRESVPQKNEIENELAGVKKEIEALKELNEKIARKSASPKGRIYMTPKTSRALEAMLRKEGPGLLKNFRKSFELLGRVYQKLSKKNNGGDGSK